MWDHTNIKWLDLSYNYLVTIDDELLNFPHLKTLYLHGNFIPQMKEVVKLQNLPNLRTLTLHGNPIEQITGYRMYVIGIMLEKFQILKKFDTVLITKKERDNVIVWNTRLKKNKRAKIHTLKIDDPAQPPAKEEEEGKEGEKKKEDL